MAGPHSWRDGKEARKVSILIITGVSTGEMYHHFLFKACCCFILKACQGGLGERVTIKQRTERLGRELFGYLEELESR